MITTINPTEHHLEAATYLVECCGLLQYWVTECPEDIDLKQYLEESYGMGKLFEMSGGTVTSDGVYHYPNDPALYPLIKFEHQQETVYIYQYGIVVIVYKDEKPDFVTRMD